MAQLTIDNRLIGDETDCYVIAEIGHNHQGDVEIAKKMFQTAKDCGADAVKLQKRNNKALFCKSLYDSPYDSENSYGATYGEHRDALEFGYDEYKILKDYAAEIGITMFATAFDFPSVDFLEKLDMPAYKVASGDLNNTPLLKYIAQTGKPMIVSTGGGTMTEVKRAYHTIMSIDQNLAILQCTASYPCEPENMNLSVIPKFRELFHDAVIGLSDHQSGIAMAIVAYSLGARIVEKHFTLNRAWRGTDHAFSLEPVGLSKLVRDLHRAKLAIGSSDKKRIPLEEKPLFKMGKKLVAAHDLPLNHVLTREDIAIKSPSDGLPPYEIDKVIGKAIKKPLKADENISFDSLGNA
jgi:sialic acid synthase